MTFIIAEAGVNHQGDLRTAEHLIVAAKRAGADAVKFQLFSAEKLGRPELKELELSYDDMAGLRLYAERLGIEFMCTPFDVEAVKFLAPLVKRMKISSGCMTRQDILQSVYDTNLPVILSTGMATHEEALWAARFFIPRTITLLHCTSAYPCPLDEVNLKAMQKLWWPYGYSDHTEGITVPIAAAAMGASVIEKHLTLDRNMKGPDHKASAEPSTFAAMVSGIRQVEKALGDGVKVPQKSEEETMRIWRGQQ